MAAKRRFKKLLAGRKFERQCIVTHDVRNYGAAQHKILPEVRNGTVVI
jgi:hypothetical protein